MSNNLAVLKDKAYDVDADLRFMALDDFQRYLNDGQIIKNFRHIEAFIPILFKLLNDEASEVQNQAVKSFSPIMNFINDDEILKIISRLFNEIIKINTKEQDQHNYKKFTTSIPNMVLRSIFNNSTFKFKNPLSRNIIDLIIPTIFEYSINIDSIEILIDLFKNLGIFLKDEEIIQLLVQLLSLTFNTSGISSKRSIVAFDYLLIQLNRIDDQIQTQYLDQIIDEINLNFENTNKSINDINHRFIIYQVLLNNLKKINDSNNLSIKSFNKIFNVLLINLNLNDEINLEDFDLDLIIQKNLIREDALITLNDLICAINYQLIEPKLNQIWQIIEYFIDYNPLQNNKDDEFEFDDDDDIEFSDDDEDDEIKHHDDDDDDGNAHKLRIQSIELLKNLVINFDVLSIIYQGLINQLIKSINDDNVGVSNEAIKCIIIILNNTKNESNLNYIGPQLQQLILSNLLITKNLYRFNNFNQLLKTLIINTFDQIDENFIYQIYQKLNEFKISSNNSSEILSLYRIILNYIDIKYIPHEFIIHIIKDLSISINESTYHNFINESLNITNLLLIKLNQVDFVTDLINQVLIESIITKIHNKQYLSDLRQRAIYSLTEILRLIPVNQLNLSKIIQIYQESLNYEVTVNYTIENMIRLIDSGETIEQLLQDEQYLQNLLIVLQQFISSSDVSLYVNSIRLLNNLINRGQLMIEFNKLLTSLLIIIQETNDYRIINLCLESITKIFNTNPNINNYQFFQNFIKVINKFNDEDIEELNLIQFEFLITSIIKDNFNDYYELSIQLLNLKYFISAKIIAIIIYEGKLNSIIEIIENELIIYLNGDDINQDRIIFNIQLLGNLSQKQLIKINLDNFYQILNQSLNELIRLAASRSIGLYITKDLSQYLPQVLIKYEQNSNNNILLLVAIKQVLKTVKISFEICQYLWNMINQIIKSQPSNISELKSLGDILSNIIIHDFKFYQQFINTLQQQDLNQSQIYTNIVIIKQLVGQGIHVKSQDESLIVNTLVKYSEVPNIENKQAIISTILTGIHNRGFFTKYLNEVILPMIFKELEAKEIFKKTIPMGPYKCIIDEGLEIRKLSYELLYTIIEDDQVDYGKIYQNIIEKGLKDLENDIIVLSSINLIQLINKVGIEQCTNSIDELVEVLSLQLNKKIRNKASTQEVESYEEGIKSIIKLLKVINQQLNNNIDGNYYMTWIQYYNDIKMKHPILYNLIEV